MVDGWTDRRTDGWMDRRGGWMEMVDGQWSDGWHGWMAGWKVGWLVGWCGRACSCALRVRRVRARLQDWLGLGWPQTRAMQEMQAMPETRIPKAPALLATQPSCCAFGGRIKTLRETPASANSAYGGRKPKNRCVSRFPRQCSLESMQNHQKQGRVPSSTLSHQKHSHQCPPWMRMI